MQKYTYIYWIHTDAIINRRRKSSLTKYTAHFIVRFVCERELETEQKLQYFDPKHMAVSVVSFSFSWCSTGGPEAHSARWWLSLLHLISNFPGPQLVRAPRPLWPDVALPTTSRPSPSPTLTATVWLLSWLSYIIVQRSLSRQLDFWNRMLDHHQAEINVMQFTGHSLPVHQSMSVPWEFFLPRPISSANFRPRDFLS